MKIEIGYRKDKLYGAAASALMISLSHLAVVAGHRGGKSRPILIDRSMTGRATARAKIPIFREIAAPR